MSSAYFSVFQATVSSPYFLCNISFLFLSDLLFCEDISVGDLWDFNNQIDNRSSSAFAIPFQVTVCRLHKI